MLQGVVYLSLGGGRWVGTKLSTQHNTGFFGAGILPWPRAEAAPEVESHRKLLAELKAVRCLLLHLAVWRGP